MTINDFVRSSTGWLHRAARRTLAEIGAYVPFVRRLLEQRRALRAGVIELRAQLEEWELRVRERDARISQMENQLGVWVSAEQFVPPGHFYSPIPSPDDIEARTARMLGPPPRQVPGVEMRETEQLALLDSFLPYYRTQPFPEQRASRCRYFFENPAYSYADAIFLHCLLRHTRPTRLIEVGSGYSSCAILDTNELFLENRMSCTFIDPFPETLKSLICEKDQQELSILPRRMQDVDLRVFEELNENDALVIDSSHVVKVGSDVQYLFYEVLPRLRRGVYVHFHDVFYPFEYPRYWLDEGRAWNEAYILRAFLTFNDAFDIVLFNTFIHEFHRAWLEQHMPLCLRNVGGSLWLRRSN